MKSGLLWYLTFKFVPPVTNISWNLTSGVPNIRHNCWKIPIWAEVTFLTRIGIIFKLNLYRGYWTIKRHGWDKFHYMHIEMKTTTKKLLSNSSSSIRFIKYSVSIKEKSCSFYILLQFFSHVFIFQTVQTCRNSPPWYFIHGKPALNPE